MVDRHGEDYQAERYAPTMQDEMDWIAEQNKSVEGIEPVRPVERFKRTAAFKALSGVVVWNFTSSRPLTDKAIMLELGDLGYGLARWEVTIMDTPDALEVL